MLVFCFFCFLLFSTSILFFVLVSFLVVFILESFQLFLELFFLEFSIFLVFFSAFLEGFPRFTRVLRSGDCLAFSIFGPSKVFFVFFSWLLQGKS